MLNYYYQTICKNPPFNQLIIDLQVLINLYYTLAWLFPYLYFSKFILRIRVPINNASSKFVALEFLFCERILKNIILATSILYAVKIKLTRITTGESLLC